MSRFHTGHLLALPPPIQTISVAQGTGVQLTVPVWTDDAAATADTNMNRIANVLRTVDPQALRQPCGHDSWPILGGVEAPLDETATSD